MSIDGVRRRSRWLLRVMEWDDARARYPNIWHEGLPRHLLSNERQVGRLRLGDLLGIYYPQSSRHPERSDRFVGLVRVVGLRQGDKPNLGWIDLEPVHRFEPPLDLGRMPSRVFLCCDPEWPKADVELFRELYDAATAAGWKPREAERVEPEHDEASAARPSTSAADPTSVAVVEPRVEAEPEAVVAESKAIHDTRPREERRSPAIPQASERLFAGADYSGNMRDPRDGTWLAVVGLAGERLHVLALSATGRHGLQASLRDPSRNLMHAEAIGLCFPFGLPTAFAESLMGGEFPEEGWWALARRLEKTTWPSYISALQEFRETKGEVRRLADERAGVGSPLRRVDPDMGSRTYHGIRMIAEDRSRYAIRPFENAQGKLLFEVSPEGATLRLGLGTSNGPPKPGRILSALSGLERLPLEVPEPFHKLCLENRHALDAVIAARCAATAVISREVDRSPDELAPDSGDTVRREGWIYGLEDPR